MFSIVRTKKYLFNLAFLTDPYFIKHLRIKIWYPTLYRKSGIRLFRLAGCPDKSGALLLRYFSFVFREYSFIQYYYHQHLLALSQNIKYSTILYNHLFLLYSEHSLLAFVLMLTNFVLFLWGGV
jgi:hypothetical protein